MIDRGGGLGRWPALLALCVGLSLAIFFGMRAWSEYRFAQRVVRGDVQIETIRGWMTLPYIARVHGVPEPRLREALGLPSSGDDDRSLRKWFEAAGIEPDAGRRTVETLILSRDGGRRVPERPSDP